MTGTDRRAVVAPIAAGKDVYLPANQPVSELPLEAQVLYHIVDLFEGLYDTLGDAVLEGHVLYQMAGAFGIKTKTRQRTEVDEFLRSVDTSVRQRLEELIVELEQAGFVKVFRGDDPNRGWKLQPKGMGYQAIYKWRRGRMEQLERIAMQPRGWRRYIQELLSPTGAIAGVIGAAVTVLLTRVLGG